MAINVSKKLIVANETSYFARNTSSAMASAETIAFRVNKSAGTHHTIDKTHKPRANPHLSVS